jgi:hypothetical protein
MPPSGAAGAGADEDGGVSSGGAARAAGAAQPQAPADAERVRVPKSVPGFVSREGLCAAVERGGPAYDPLYLWTAEARDAAWRGLPSEERRKLSNRFGEQMRVRGPRAAAAAPQSCRAVHSRATHAVAQAYYAIEIVGCAAQKQKELLKATKDAVGSRAVFEDVVEHVKQKLAAQAA